jgi:NADH-quinone oxidoreductase subunit F
MFKVKVGMATCGISAGAKATYEKLDALIKGNGVIADLTITGCMGMCYSEPLVEVLDDQTNTHILYGGVDPEGAERIYREHLKEGQPVEDLIVLEWTKNKKPTGPQASFIADQERIVLRNCGVIDPENISDYIARGGYDAAMKVLSKGDPQWVLDEIKASGLRGRGGAGFPTGLKWSFAAAQKSDVKYVVCNADEGDPGAFMDRSVLEGDPHAVLEGMLICAYAIGAHHGYVYCRAEYPLAVKRLRLAIKQAEELGFLGHSIKGSGFDFKIKIKEGAGAFVCGEETALFASIEGERGMPRIRPPFPAEKGLWRKPTNNNNVETYANIPWIINRGARAYRRYGTKDSPGTKVFALAGKVKRGGLAEVPMGVTIRELVFDVGGGIKGDKEFKAVQMGGPSGGCIPRELDDTPVDFEHIPATGAIMGSGGMVVMDEDTCMVDVARFFLDFTQKESCGKCTFCRLGTLRMLEILERICGAEGRPEDKEKLASLSQQIKDASLCGLGQTAPNPVLTTLRYFEHEYDAHILEGYCPAKVCPTLVDYVIDAEKCIGCVACAKGCPVDCISGEKKKPHFIDQEACIKCAHCITVCPVDAVLKIAEPKVPEPVAAE